MQKKFQDFINESESRPNPRKKVIDRQLAMSNKEIGNISRFQKYQTDMDSDYRKVPMKKRAAMYDVYKKVYDLVMADPNLSARFQKDLKGMLDADLNKKGIQEQQDGERVADAGLEKSNLYNKLGGLLGDEVLEIFREKQLSVEKILKLPLGDLRTVVEGLLNVLSNLVDDPTAVSKVTNPN